MIVQFSVDGNECAKLQQLANANGYLDVSSYCRDVALEERTYANMWKKIKDEIAKMPSGHTFALRDLVQSPPANLGVKLFENQSALGIRVNSQKDSLDTNTYTKL
ncbi:MAG: hypothetical protein IJM46_13015 [Oscillospiraceae bacterium]|nr:hypothetical protein [Oscillospiraceae bacterium]